MNVAGLAFRRVYSGEVARGSAGAVSRRHPYAVLSYQAEGELEMEHGGPLSLRRGSLHLIPAGRAHGMKIARDAEVWGVAIPQSLLDAERNAELRVPMDRVLSGALPHVTVPEERRAFVVSLFAELASLRGAPTVRIESLLVLLLAEFGAHMHHGKFQDAPHFARPDRDIAAQAVSFIAGSALGKLSLADVATALRRNRTHVADVVKRETGLTVGELIADFRLDEACRRLSETDELVEVIGERVGYADPTHFTRMFRRKFGVSPRAWRKANRQNLSAAR